MDDQVKRLKRQLKAYMKRMQECGVMGGVSEMEERKHHENGDDEGNQTLPVILKDSDHLRMLEYSKAVEDSVKKESGHDFMLDSRNGYIHACPTNLGTGMRASVHIDLPGWTKLGPKVLAARCEELHLEPRVTRGESGGQTGVTYDISNKHRLGYSEVELVQKMIDGVNTLYKEDKSNCL